MEKMSRGSGLVCALATVLNSSGTSSGNADVVLRPQGMSITRSLVAAVLGVEANQDIQVAIF